MRRRLAAATRSIHYDTWPLGLLLAGLLVAIVTPLLSVRWYGTTATWPSLISNFSATCLAFLIALAWDRRQRAYADVREAAAEQRREESARRREREHRVDEARRRLAGIAVELDRIEQSLTRTVADQHRHRCYFPDLPSGSWRASGERLGLISSDHGLVADLATFYGYVEELRWRLRFKAGGAADVSELNPIIDALAKELVHDVSALRQRVLTEGLDPELQSEPEQTTSSMIATRRERTAVIHAPLVGAALADEASTHSDADHPAEPSHSEAGG